MGCTMPRRSEKPTPLGEIAKQPLLSGYSTFLIILAEFLHFLTAIKKSVSSVGPQAFEPPKSPGTRSPILPPYPPQSSWCSLAIGNAFREPTIDVEVCWTQFPEFLIIQTHSVDTLGSVRQLSIHLCSPLDYH